MRVRKNGMGCKCNTAGVQQVAVPATAPEKFAAAAARNPVCNLALMVGTTDIPNWCFFEAFGSVGKYVFTESPSAEHLALLYTKSPISHVEKVKTLTLFLLGAKDLRVPIYDGIMHEH